MVMILYYANQMNYRVSSQWHYFPAPFFHLKLNCQIRSWSYEKCRVCLNVAELQRGQRILITKRFRFSSLETSYRRSPSDSFDGFLNSSDFRTPFPVVGKYSIIFLNHIFIDFSNIDLCQFEKGRKPFSLLTLQKLSEC